MKRFTTCVAAALWLLVPALAHFAKRLDVTISQLLKGIG